ncbi:MAG: DUF932 domain-containing protein [Nitrososphaerota archaeon]|nr:DUF932 domain-containing protein [Nitrososphaerota archaeon]
MTSIELNELGTNKGGLSPSGGAGLRNPDDKVAPVGKETTGFVNEFVDNTWVKYGIRTAVGAFDRTGLTPKRYQLVEIEPNAQRHERMTIVKGLTFRLIPNEVALDVANALAEKHGFKQDRVEYGRGGLSVYASYISNDRPKEVKVGDLVAVGFQMKNSIDGSTGYRFSGYTLRLACTNGMTVPEGRNTVSLPKLIDVAQLTKDAESAMEPLMAGLEEQLQTYRQWTQIGLNMQLANILAVSLPKKYLPFIDFAKKTKAVVGFQHMTVWDAFNRITDPLTHTKLEARHRDWFRARLNRAIETWAEVQNGTRSMDDALLMVGSF